MNSSFLKSVLVSNLRKSLAQRGPCDGAAFNLFVQIADKSVIAGTAILRDASADGKGRLPRRPHNHDLPCTRIPIKL